jgi:hypothetical protein
MAKVKKLLRKRVSCFFWLIYLLELSVGLFTPAGENRVIAKTSSAFSHLLLLGRCRHRVPSVN